MVELDRITFFARTLGFANSMSNCANKIWVFWMEDLTVNLFKDHNQCLTVSVNTPWLSQSLFISFAYAKNLRSERKILWDELCEIASILDGPWVVGGDFNAVLNVKESKGGDNPNQGSMEEFGSCLLDCGMLDAGYEGNDFTWTNDLFYQHCWDIIGEDLVEAVVDFFNRGVIPKGVSSTTIVLIPKVPHPKTWSEFRPISLCPVLVLHLAFADDIIIFSNSTKSSLKRITNFLAEYEQCSGQKVNSSKSGFILSARASLFTASVVGGALGFPRIRLPTKYLGMPLYKGPKKSFLWDDLISRIAARMEGWEAKVLSSGGRITILKSILTSMPLYLLHVIVPPKSVMRRIERLFNKFLWSSKGQKRIHWECWEDLCYPVEEGGLGMRRLQDLVNVMSLKLWWRFRGASVHDSPIWKRLSKASRACDNLIRWKVGCGKINFWHDIWVDDSALSSTRVDHPLWSLTANGGFTMYSAWNRRLLNDFIPVDTRLQSKGICMVSKCYGCNHIESLEHLFLFCPSVSPIWNFFAAMFSVSLPVDGSIRHCLSAWFFSDDYVSAGHIRIIILLFDLWFIWLERNDVEHRNMSFYPDRIRWKCQGKIFQLFQAGLLKRRNWKGDMKMASFFQCHYVLDKEYSPKIVQWIKPKEHCFKLNVDGSFQGNSDVAGGGGILRDWHGNVSFFFFLPLKAKSVLHAEILTLYHGLNICKDRGIGRVWIEMDALSVINLVQNRCIGSWEVCYSLQGIYDCLDSFQFHLSHIYREGNQVADHLAALGSKAANLHIGSSLNAFPSLRGMIRTDKLNLPYFHHAFI
ncbi:RETROTRANSPOSON UNCLASSIFIED-LIKE PROTEIN [Salix purpurea]|uniref:RETROTRANSPOSON UNCLASSIFIED-LIKE PROTEIN n=1 Tax=Salix purpurea TaxID=77065 RepID=A0A9Q0SPP1_SALPP|nr:RETROTRANSPOSON UNCLASSIFIED-LIKE PROTEIN [Salix purpurea]